MRNRFGSATTIPFACLCFCVLAAPHAAAAGIGDGGTLSEPDTLQPGEALDPGQGRMSTSGEYRLVYQGDGNLVLYSYGTPLWASDTAGTAAGQAVMQYDGNFVVYDAYWNPLRASNTNGYSGARLVVQNDGNVVIYTPEGVPLWDRHSAQWGSQGPPPGVTSFTILINGSFNATPEWAQPGSGTFNAIAETYGAPPMTWQWTTNGFSEVIPPFYSGIIDGGFHLANFLYSLPPGDVNLVSHSHGGNVVLMSQYWSSRPIRRYIQLATPINWDFGDWRYALGYGVAGRCQASSTADWLQFFGSWPYQVGNFFYHVYHSMAGAIEAFEALINGDYDAAYWWFGASVFDAIQADYWLDTTRIEVEGPTLMFGGLSHADLHEPPVWNSIGPWCH